MKFNYYLVIGSQRPSSTSSKNFGTQTHVVQFPFRVFNHVIGKENKEAHLHCYICLTDPLLPFLLIEDGSRPVYDLMRPEISYRDKAVIEKINEDLSDFKKEDAAYFGISSRHHGSKKNTGNKL